MIDNGTVVEGVLHPVEIATHGVDGDPMIVDHVADHRPHVATVGVGAADLADHAKAGLGPVDTATAFIDAHRFGKAQHAEASIGDNDLGIRAIGVHPHDALEIVQQIELAVHTVGGHGRSTDEAITQQDRLHCAAEDTRADQVAGAAVVNIRRAGCRGRGTQQHLKTVGDCRGRQGVVFDAQQIVTAGRDGEDPLAACADSAQVGTARRRQQT